MSNLYNFKEKILSKLKEKEDENKKKNINSVTIKNTNNSDDKKTIESVAEKMVTKTDTNNELQKPKTIVSGQYDGTPKKDDDVEEKLKEIDERHSLLEFYDVPDSLDLDTKEMPTFDEAKERGDLEKELTQKYQGKKNILLSDYDNKEKENLESKNKAQKSAQENEIDINRIYDAESLNVESQAIKRGLARSSIVLGQLGRVEGERANTLIDNLNTLNTKLSDLEEDMQKIILNRDNAMSSLDLDYAEELEESLDKKKEEYKKAADEVIEFNNKVKQLEAEYKMEYEKQKAAYKENILEMNEKGYDQYAEIMRQAKYNYMIDYYSLFSKDEAIAKFVANPNLKKLLGDDYLKVYEYLLNR